MDLVTIAGAVGGFFGAAVGAGVMFEKLRTWLATSADRAANNPRSPTTDERLRALEAGFEKLRRELGKMVRQEAQEALDGATLELVRRLNRATKKAKPKGEDHGREDDDEERRSSGA